MVRVIFDMQKMQTKILLALLIFITFSTIYILMPKDEFGVPNNYETKAITRMDMLEYSMLSQVCTFSHIYPKSLRARVLRIVHLLLGYGILLI